MARRPNFTFKKAQIPIGATLYYKRDPEITCEVVENKKVKYESKKRSLSGLTMDLYEEETGKSTNLRGTDYWEYKNEILTDRRERLLLEWESKIIGEKKIESKNNSTKFNEEEFKKENKQYQKIYDDSIKQGAKETEANATVKTRIGQGKFRELLYEKWHGCSVTDYPQKEMLIASHIKPWKDSSHEERLDTNNGLLLTANLDKAFDRGFITFADDGKILIHDKLKTPETLGIREDMQLRQVPKENKKYLNYHREEIFESNSK